MDLPLYQCHKRVRAARITNLGEREDGSHDLVLDTGADVALLMTVSAEWTQRHKPEVGGYYVVYEDGYTSFSPAKAFEEGYTAEPADFRDRVRAERQRVSDDLSKLLSFFQSPTFDTLPEAERSRMRNQARFMDGYAAVLEERIAAF